MQGQAVWLAGKIPQWGFKRLYDESKPVLGPRFSARGWKNCPKTFNTNKKYMAKQQLKFSELTHKSACENDDIQAIECATHS